MKRVGLGAACWVLSAACSVRVLSAVIGAQTQTPPIAQMSGVPLPSPELPAGTLTVRVVRGSISNNLTNQKVELTSSSGTREGTTDASGRAEFRGLTPGEPVKAAVTVDGARIESQTFPMPAQSGVRVMLVAPDAAMAERAAEDARLRNAPARPGVVVFGGNSRFIVEQGDEALNVFYVLEILNTARTPVATTAPLIFDLPSGARNVTLLEGSTAQATVGGSRVTVTSPFAPGATPLQIGYELPYRGSRATIEQELPAALPDLAAAGETTNGVTLTSPQFQVTRDMTAQGKTYKVGNGPGLAAGSTLTLAFGNLPHHPRWPRYTALGVAVSIMLAGLVAAFRAPRGPAAPDREALTGARAARFRDLEALDQERRGGAITADAYAEARARIVGELEDIYLRLDGSQH